MVEVDSDDSYGEEQFDSFDEDLDMSGRHGCARSSRPSTGSLSGCVAPHRPGMQVRQGQPSSQGRSSRPVSVPFSSSHISLQKGGDVSAPADEETNRVFRTTRNLEVDVSKFQQSKLHQNFHDDMKSTQNQQSEIHRSIPSTSAFVPVCAPIQKCDAATMARPQLRKLAARALAPTTAPKNTCSVSPQVKRKFRRDSTSPNPQSLSVPRHRRHTAKGTSAIRQRRVMSFSVPSHRSPSKLLKHAEVFLKKASKVLLADSCADDELRWLMKQVSDLVQRAPAPRQPKVVTMASRSVPVRSNRRAHPFDDALPITKLQELDKELAFLNTKYAKANDEDLVDILSKKCRNLDRELESTAKANRKIASDNYRRDRALTKGASGGGVIAGRHIAPNGMDPDLEKRRGELRRIREKHESVTTAIEIHSQHLEELEQRYAMLVAKGQQTSKQLKDAVSELPDKEESPEDYEEYELEDKLNRLGVHIEKTTQHRQRLSRRFSLTKSKIVEEVSSLQDQDKNDTQQFAAIHNQLKSIQLQMNRLESMSHCIVLAPQTPVVSIRCSQSAGDTPSSAQLQNGTPHTKSELVVEDQLVQPYSNIRGRKQPASRASNTGEQLLTHLCNHMEAIRPQIPSSRVTEPENLDEFIFSARKQDHKDEVHYPQKTPVSAVDAEEQAVQVAIASLRKRSCQTDRLQTEPQQSESSEQYSSSHEEYESLPTNSPVPKYVSALFSNAEVATLPANETSMSAPISIDIAIVAAKQVTRAMPQLSTLPALASTPKPAHTSLGCIPKVEPPPPLLPTAVLSKFENSFTDSACHVQEPHLAKGVLRLSNDPINQEVKHDVEHVISAASLSGLTDFSPADKERSLNKSSFFNKHGLDHSVHPLGIESSGSPMQSNDVAKTPIADMQGVCAQVDSSAINTLGTNQIGSGALAVESSQVHSVETENVVAYAKPRRMRRSRDTDGVTSKPRWGADFLADI